MVLFFKTELQIPSYLENWKKVIETNDVQHFEENNVTGNFSLTFIKTINTNNIHILHASTIKQQTKKNLIFSSWHFFAKISKLFNSGSMQIYVSMFVNWYAKKLLAYHENSKRSHPKKNQYPIYNIIYTIKCQVQ